jgi:uncharacterized protein YgiM (DUF1202 family)
MAVFVLALGVLLCGQYITPTPVSVSPVDTVEPQEVATQPAASPTPTASPTAADVATIRATVYVRSAPDANSAEVGSLETGQSVEIVACDGSWCQIRTDVLSGYVFRGCLSDNPDGLKCEVRE